MLANEHLAILCLGTGLAALVYLRIIEERGVLQRELAQARTEAAAVKMEVRTEAAAIKMETASAMMEAVISQAKTNPAVSASTRDWQSHLAGLHKMIASNQ
jgi:hypothetical protein